MKSCITSFLKNFAVCLSGQISIFLLISCPLSFSLPPALLTPYSSFLYSSPSLIYPPGSFHPSARPCVCLVSVAAALSLQDHQSFPPACTWPSYSKHVLPHANTHITNTRPFVDTHTQRFHLSRMHKLSYYKLTIIYSHFTSTLNSAALRTQRRKCFWSLCCYSILHSNLLANYK